MNILNNKTFQVAAAIILYLAGVLFYSVFISLEAESKILDNYDKTLAAAAKSAITILGENFHERVKDKNSISPEEDLSNIVKLTKMTADMGLSFIYTVTNDSGILRFAAVAATSDELKNGTYVKYFTPYESAPQILKEAFKTDHITYGDYTDKWGSFRSVFVPFKTADGKMFVAGADIKLQTIKTQTPPIIFRAVISIFFFVLLAIPIVWAFQRLTRQQGSALKEYQAQLAHASRLTSMGEMAAGIAHEINQPLCVIRGYVELLQNCLKNDPIIKEKNLSGAFAICIKSVEKVSTIIKHMRSFVRTKINEHPDPVNLAEIIDEALSFFNEQIRLHNINLTKNYMEPLPEVKIDPRRFEQVIVNFISNSRYSVDKKGEMLGREFKKEISISLETVNSGSRVLMTIKDNGIGMPPEVLKRCKEPFFSTKPDGEGMGLGLAIVQGILTDAGGTFDIESSEKEGGCTIKVSLPAM